MKIVLGVAAVTVWALASPSYSLEAQSPAPALSLSCRLSASSGIPTFRLTLTNADSTDLTAVMGVIWRGEYLPTHVGLTVHWPETEGIDEFEWSPPRTQVVIKGPVDPWILTLRAGASHTLLLGGADFVDVYRAVPLRLNTYSAAAEVVAHLDSRLREGLLPALTATNRLNIWSGTTYSMKIAVPGDCSEMSEPR